MLTLRSLQILQTLGQWQFEKTISFLTIAPASFDDSFFAEQKTLDFYGRNSSRCRCGGWIEWCSR